MATASISLKTLIFLDYFRSYIDNYTKKDIRHLKSALRHFENFLAEKHPIYKISIKPEQLNRDMMTAFVEYLESKSKGEGAHSTYKRFKKVIKYAHDHGVLKTNPCNGVVCKIDDQTLRKDILSIEEMQKLIQTTYAGQNPEIRRAFIFSLYTGVRFCDLIELRYSKVDYQNRLLSWSS